MMAPSGLVHFNTAGSGLNSKAVTEAVIGYLRDEARLGSYEMELAYAEILEKRVYEAVAELLSSKPEDIALFDSATRAWSTAAALVPFKRGDRIWITPYEYAGNILALQHAIKAYDLRLEVIPTDSKGDLDLDWMKDALDERVALVSVVHIPSNCGIVAPVEAIGRLLSKADRPPFYFIDACQSVGLLPIDVNRFKCDVLTGAGRKFLCGPRGTAFAYISPRFRAEAPPRMSDLHVAEVRSLDEIVHSTSSAKRYELLERANAAFVGLDVALRERLASAPTQTSVYQALTDMLCSHAGISLIAPGSRQAGIVSFFHETFAAERIVSALRDAGINSWVVNGRHTPIHMSSIGVERVVRLSVHFHNSHDDIRALDSALCAILSAPDRPQAMPALEQNQREMSQ